jgi:GT2 family glycosyltransferase
MQENNKVSIIIPIFNQWSYTSSCLESIEKNTLYPYELIIIDNNSKDNSVNNLLNYKGIELIKNKINTGYAHACNQGAQVAKGELLLFLNNDTIVTRGWLVKMLECLSSNNKIAVVGSKLLFPQNNTIQHAGVVLHGVLPGHIYYKEPGNLSFANIKKYYPAVTGACLLSRKKLFLSLGGFDEKFINGYEDVDYCLRVWENGYKIVYCPESTVYHYGSVSENRHLREKENQEYYKQKWGIKLISGKIIDINMGK